jgi:hypothetical protein
MAVLTGPVVLASGGGSGTPRWAVLAFQNVTTADTFDCSTLTAIPPFVTVTDAYTAPTSNRTATKAVSTIATNTVVSLIGTGIARDSCLLFIMGE